MDLQCHWKSGKVTTIKLPSFDGKIEEWTQFSDAFRKFITIRHQGYRSSYFCDFEAAARAIELFDDNYSVGATAGKI